MEWETLTLVAACIKAEQQTVTLAKRFSDVWIGLSWLARWKWNLYRWIGLPSCEFQNV